MGDLLVGLLVAQAIVLAVLLLVGRLLFPWILGTKDIARELHAANELKRQELAKGGTPAQPDGTAPPMGAYVLTPNGWQLRQ